MFRRYYFLKFGLNKLKTPTGRFRFDIIFIFSLIKSKLKVPIRSMSMCSVMKNIK